MAERGRRRHLPRVPINPSRQGPRPANVWDEGEDDREDACQNYEDR